MKQFLDDIILYIKNAINADTDITKTVKVDKAYKYNDTITPPQISVQSIDDNDAELYNTYDGEEVSYCPIQITVYCNQMKIGNATKSAQDCSLIIADKIKALFDMKDTVEWNKNIVRMRRVGGTPSMPIETGATTYMSPIRYDFYVAKNYLTITNNN